MAKRETKGYPLFPGRGVGSVYSLQVSLDKSSPFLNHWLHYLLPLRALISAFHHPLKRENFLVFRVAYKFCHVSPSSATVPDTTHTIRTSLNISLASLLNLLVRTHVRVSAFEIRCMFDQVRQLNMDQPLNTMTPRAFRSRLHKPFHGNTTIVHTAWPKPAEDLLLRATLFGPLVHTPVQVCCAPNLQVHGLLVSGICVRGNTGSMRKWDEAAPR